MKVTEKYYDEIFHFAGLWDVPSACGLKTVNKTIVIVTELYRTIPEHLLRKPENCLYNKFAKGRACLYPKLCI